MRGQIRFSSKQTQKKGKTVTVERFGRCDFCGRQQRLLRANDILYTGDGVAGVRRVCIDLEDCRAEGGDPPPESDITEIPGD